MKKSPFFKGNLNIKKVLIVLVMISIIIILHGCAQSTREVSARNTIEKEKKELDKNKYKSYLIIMNENQRANFFKLDNDYERDRFIKLEGLDRKKYLIDNLKLKMTSQEIIKLLGEPNLKERIKDEKGNNIMYWTYSFFSGLKTIKYMLIFKNKTLREWIWLDKEG